VSPFSLLKGNKVEFVEGPSSGHFKFSEFLRGGFVAHEPLATIAAFDVRAGSEPAIFHPGDDARHARIEIAGQFAFADIIRAGPGIGPFAEVVDLVDRERIKLT
jgi:hypothetical protein